MENRHVMKTSHYEENSRDCTQRSAPLTRLFSWTLLGNVGYAACQWALLVILAKCGSPRDVGVLSLALTLTAPVYLLTNFQLRSVLATRMEVNRMTKSVLIHRLNELDVGAYVGMRIASSCAALFISFVIGLYGGYHAEVFMVIVLIACSKSIEAGCDIIYGWWHKHEQMRWGATSLLWRGIGSVIVFGGIYQLSGQLSAALVGYTVVWLFVLLLHDIPKAKRLSGFCVRWNMREWGTLLRHCWPLGATMMMISLQWNVPRYFIAHSFGNEVLGYFSALMYVMIAGTTVMNAIGQSISPRMARWYASGDRKQFTRFLLQMTGMLCGGAILSIVVVLIFGKEILTLVYHASYAESEYEKIFTWMTISTSIGYLSSLYGFALTAARKFRGQMIVYVVALGITISSNWFYMDMGCGVMSVVYALTTASIMQLFGSIWLLCNSTRQFGR